MQRDQFNQQHQNKDRTSVVNAQCVIAGEKFPDAGLNCIYAIGK